MSGRAPSRVSNLEVVMSWAVSFWKSKVLRSVIVGSDPSSGMRRTSTFAGDGAFGSFGKGLKGLGKCFMGAVATIEAAAGACLI